MRCLVLPISHLKEMNAQYLSIGFNAPHFAQFLSKCLA